MIPRQPVRAPRGGCVFSWRTPTWAAFPWAWPLVGTLHHSTPFRLSSVFVSTGWDPVRQGLAGPQASTFPTHLLPEVLF